MRLYLAPDPDLRAFSIAPKTLQAWLRYARTQPAMRLPPTWPDLDALLGRTPAARSAAPLSPSNADFTFPESADRPVYALSSETTVRLLRSIDSLDRAQVEQFVRQRAGSRAAGGEVPVGADELLTQLEPLRAFCEVAVAKGYGLLLEPGDEP